MVGNRSPNPRLDLKIWPSPVGCFQPGQSRPFIVLVPTFEFFCPWNPKFYLWYFSEKSLWRKRVLKMYFTQNKHEIKMWLVSGRVFLWFIRKLGNKIGIILFKIIFWCLNFYKSLFCLLRLVKNAILIFRFVLTPKGEEVWNCKCDSNQNSLDADGHPVKSILPFKYIFRKYLILLAQ